MRSAMGSIIPVFIPIAHKLACPSRKVVSTKFTSFIYISQDSYQVYIRGTRTASLPAIGIARVNTCLS
jgi:hypothetical protein